MVTRMSLIFHYHLQGIVYIQNKTILTDISTKCIVYLY